ncbi:MAG: hypothetical protein RMI34_10620 [Chloroherpetonaceae bacterium]|nr:hypothetical protein [Chloroherpetonaceae bacterium]MCS7211801.1 hypothetical protein [Chloroherpetonaceae bacterium]MDW8020515.1 hypothetical protein [Chloroherpetonaceae bacterium]MDW8466214.1 hypothetical protein [Chloroherpetonaceae bacterium]
MEVDMFRRSTSYLLVALLLVAACRGTTTSSDDSASQDPIIGTWVSEGTNVAPILFNPPLRIRRIQATFNRDGSYTVVQRDSAGVELTLRGTYVTTPGGATGANANIRNITANQTSPTALTAQGIYEVSGNRMRYEVAQVQPPLQGVTPPTATAGFGSTSGGAFGQANVQVYIRQ